MEIKVVILLVTGLFVACNFVISILIIHLFKGLLVRWILNVFNLIDDLKDVHSLYGIFFLFLESDILVSFNKVLNMHLLVSVNKLSKRDTGNTSIMEVLSWNLTEESECNCKWINK